MLKCHLSKIMGEKRLKISDVARDTGINRGTITRIYNEEATRVELEVVEQLCAYLDIEVGQLYELIKAEAK
ncbi:helix-turn-helix transcriptional regulator [Vibrio parahaemolyticus]|nr:helix-turn-helix transcriptional regulator [Vibrio parahaemolyticus]